MRRWGPKRRCKSDFGKTVSGPVVNLVVRNWGDSIGFVGTALIHSAFSPAERPLIVRGAWYLVAARSMSHSAPHSARLAV